MNYFKFLETKKKSFIESGFEINENELNENLFDFQKNAVSIALKKGRFALFFDCGLGKTLMQLSWAEAVFNKTNKKVLILAPLAVVEQTKDEAIKFGISLESFNITNYDQLKNIENINQYSGVVLDESSILKGRDGKLSNLIIESFKNTPYKLACTATPSPNDHMELGQHSEFLGAMSYLEMLAMYFVHDGGETSKWRLRKHAKDPFWKYVCTWSMSCDNPKTLGYCHSGYSLPEIEYIEHIISVENNTMTLFGDVAVSATDLHKDLDRSFDQRIQKTIELVDKSKGQVIIWGLKNNETDTIQKLIPGSINVQGSDNPEYKAKYLNGFSKREFKTLITKTSIASFGMNYQNCNEMIFMSYDFKFEAFYQAVRRCYRFGQKNKVIVHILIPESQINVRQTILEKQNRHFEMIKEMAKYSSEADYKSNKSKIMITKKEIKTDQYHLFNGDCVQESKKINENAADLIIFSPPFAELYVYSDKEEDMGNVSDYKQFEQHFKFLIPELKRILKPGRICAIHCMDLPIQKGKEGYIGLRDFSGMLIDWFTECGFIYASRITIWKDPVVEMQRTKALGLLHKQVKKDSTMSRVGIPDYVMIFRKDGERNNPVKNTDLSVDLWQKYASPVWMDINYGNTLQGYRNGREENDEKHICPLQLDTIERLIHLYSNKGDTVFTPFMGIGSEVYQAVKMNRKGIGFELKESYYDLAKANLKSIVSLKSQTTLF